MTRLRPFAGRNHAGGFGFTNARTLSSNCGETAPLIVVGVATFIVVTPDSPFSKFTSMTAQIYQWTSRPQAEFKHLAAAGIIALLILLLALNAGAILLRNRYARREY